VLGIPGTFTGQLGIAGITSGTAILKAQPAAGSAVSFLPTSAGTLVGTAAAPLAINAVTGQASITGLSGGVLAGAAPAFTSTPVLGASGTLGSLGFGNATSGIVTVQPVAGALGTVTISLPAAAGTFAVSATSPLVLGASSGALTCPTCVTSSGGGAITGTAPITVSAAGVVALTTPLALNFGGTNASLTANNGGIVWSNTTQLQILAGTATARQMLQSGATATPAWSTTTWPATSTINRLLFSSSSNVIGEVLTANGGMLNASSSGVPGITVTPVLGVAGSTVGSIGFQNATSGTETIQPATGALGSGIATLPAGTYNIVGDSLTQTLTGKTLGATTLSGTVSGGGNQINNVVIGAVTPLAGSFTSVSSTTGVSVTNNSNAALSGFTGTNTDAGASAAVTSNFAVTNAGTFRVAANSTAAGAFAIMGWTGSGGIFFDQNNAVGEINFRTGPTPSSVLRLLPDLQTIFTGTMNLVIPGATTSSLVWNDSSASGVSWTMGPRTGTGVATLFGFSGGAVGLIATWDGGTADLVGRGGLLSLSPTRGVGYSAGAGGAVTQITSRTTGVTLNKVSGSITLFAQVNTAISQATAQSFTVTNSVVAATDVIVVSQKSGTDKYEIFVTNVAAGSFQITDYAVAGTTNEAPVFNFAVIKAVAN